MIVLSVILICTVLFLPMCNRGIIGAELFPNDRSIYFTDVIEIISENSNPFRYYVVTITMIALVCGILLFIGSILRSKILCRISSLGGGIGLLFIMNELINERGSDKVFGTDGTIVAIGFWICTVIFIVCFVNTLIPRR